SASALLEHMPRLYILHEPTTHVEPIPAQKKRLLSAIPDVPAPGGAHRPSGSTSTSSSSVLTLLEGTVYRHSRWSQWQGSCIFDCHGIQPLCTCTTCLIPCCCARSSVVNTFAPAS